MKKLISLILCFVLLFQFAISSLAVEMGNVSIETRSGKLSGDETWSGTVQMTGDVIVPEGITLTISPGTVIKLADYDDTAGGKYPDRCELIIYGKLKIEGDKKDTITFISKRGVSPIIVPLNPEIKNVVVKPYKVDTESLRDEFRTFRIQYAILWVVLTVGLYYGVKSRFY